MKNGNDLTKQPSFSPDEILSDPYGYTFSEFSQVFGGGIAEKYFNILYREKPKEQYQTIAVKNIFTGGDTQRYVYELCDGKCVETVCIRRKDGITACVSTQVGCPVGCVFCESGKNGFVRNLTASEIVQQIIYLRKKVTRIVFMGMGEPLYNYVTLIKVIHILRERKGLNFPTDGITVSTVGPVAQLKKLREEHIKIQLTVSLHATTQTTRNLIMPNMRSNDIEAIVQAALSYSERHNRKIVIAYLLLPGVNDKPADVRRLGKWFREKNVMINILEYNKTSRSGIRTPSKQELFDFKQRLETAGLNVTLRVSHGRDIKAACGQLAGKYNKPLHKV